MRVYQAAISLVFLGAFTTVNAQSNAGQADKPLLLVENTPSITMVNKGQTLKTVSSIESRELRAHINDKLEQTLNDRLTAQLAFPTTNISID